MHPNFACTYLALGIRFRVYRGGGGGGGGSGPPCTKNIPHLHALGPQFCMYTSGAGNLVSSIGKAGSGTPSKKNIPHLHAPQFCMYEKHIWPTVRFRFRFRFRFRVYRRGVLAQLVRKTYHIYMHPNSACIHLALGIRFRV